MNEKQTILLGPQQVETAGGNDGAAGIALCGFAIGSLMAVAGVYLLCGTGWALIAGAIPVTAVSAALLRGLKHGS